MKITDLNEADTYADVPTLLTAANSRTKLSSWLTVLNHLRNNQEIANKNGTMYTVFTVPKLDERFKQYKTNILAALSEIKDSVTLLEYVKALQAAGLRWPELQKLYTENHDKTFKLIANELVKTAEVWVGYHGLDAFFKAFDKLEKLKLVPDLKPILTSLSPKLIKSLNLIIKDGYIERATGIYEKLTNLGLKMPASLKDMVDANKDTIIKGMLSHIKHAYNDNLYDPSRYLKRIKLYNSIGINWPELSTINKSLMSQKQSRDDTVNDMINRFMPGYNANR